MKRIIINASEAIFGMSYPKSKALQILDANSKQLNAHLIKYVLYKDIRKDSKHHWINEMSAWLNSANRVTCKSKLRERDYEDTLFGWFGTTIDDAEINLELFYNEYVKRSPKPYPEFEITPSIVNDLYDVYIQLKRIALPILVKHELLSTESWARILRAILD